MSAQLEEVLLHSHFRQAQHLRVNPRHQLFHRCPWSDVICATAAPHHLRRRQRLPVHFPVSRQRQPPQQHQRTRHHVSRQSLPQRAPHLRPQLLLIPLSSTYLAPLRFCGRFHSTHTS